MFCRFGVNGGYLLWTSCICYTGKYVVNEMQINDGFYGKNKLNNFLKILMMLEWQKMVEIFAERWTYAKISESFTLQGFNGILRDHTFDKGSNDIHETKLTIADHVWNYAKSYFNVIPQNHNRNYVQNSTPCLILYSKLGSDPGKWLFDAKFSREALTYSILSLLYAKRTESGLCGMVLMVVFLILEAVDPAAWGRLFDCRSVQGVGKQSA